MQSEGVLKINESVYSKIKVRNVKVEFMNKNVFQTRVLSKKKCYFESGLDWRSSF